MTTNLILGADNEDLGVYLAGDAVTASIILGKIKGIRASLCHTEYLAKMAREHNDANVLVIGSYITGPQVALTFIEPFINTKLDFDENTVKHKRRVDKIMMIEQKGAQLFSKKID